MLAISIPRTEAHVTRHFHERMPFGLFMRDVNMRHRSALTPRARLGGVRPILLHINRPVLIARAPDSRNIFLRGKGHGFARSISLCVVPHLRKPAAGEP
jgi:hypothetical protein